MSKRCLCHFIDPCPGTIGIFERLPSPRPEQDWDGKCQCKTPKVVHFPGNQNDLGPETYCGNCLGDLDEKR